MELQSFTEKETVLKVFRRLDFYFNNITVLKVQYQQFILLKLQLL